MVTFSIIFEDHEVLVIAGGMAGGGEGGVGGGTSKESYRDQCVIRYII